MDRNTSEENINDLFPELNVDFPDEEDESNFSLDEANIKTEFPETYLSDNPVSDEEKDFIINSMNKEASRNVLIAFIFFCALMTVAVVSLSSLAKPVKWITGKDIYFEGKKETGTVTKDEKFVLSLNPDTYEYEEYDLASLGLENEELTAGDSVNIYYKRQYDGNGKSVYLFETALLTKKVNAINWFFFGPIGAIMVFLTTAFVVLVARKAYILRKDI